MTLPLRPRRTAVALSLSASVALGVSDLLAGSTARAAGVFRLLLVCLPVGCVVISEGWDPA